MPSDLPRYTLRIPEQKMAKLRRMAAQNQRSVNREIEYALTCYIREFEDAHGPVDCDSPDSD